MTIERVLELILGNLGVLILLLAILVGGFKGWWVYGRYYEALQKDRQERLAEKNEEIKRLERRLERAVGVAETGTVAADRATRVAERTVEGSDAR